MPESSGRRGFVRNSNGFAANDLVRDRHQVARSHILGHIGKRGDAAIALREFGVRGFVTEFLQRLAKGVAARVLAEDERTRRNADSLPEK